MIVKLVCPDCRRYYQISDERVPSGQALSLHCPSCEEAFLQPVLIGATYPGDLHGEALKQAFLQEDRALPPVPDVLLKARTVVDSPYGDVEALAAVLATDQGMTTRVLKLANSAFYGARNPVRSVQDACMVLGEQALLQLVTLVSASKLLDKGLVGYKLTRDAVFYHSLGVAVAAKEIAALSFPELATDAFSAGLLHDCGLLILDEHVAAYPHLFSAIMEKGGPYHMAEKEFFGFDHGEIGHDYCRKWQVPKAQATAIRWHHQPLAGDTAPLTHVVHLANALAGYTGEVVTESNLPVSKETLPLLQLTEEDLAGIFDKMKTAVEEIVSEMHSLT